MKLTRLVSITTIAITICLFQNCAKSPETAVIAAPSRMSIGQAVNGSTYYILNAPNSACLDLYKEDQKIYSCQHKYEFAYNNRLIGSGTGAYGRLLSLSGTLLHEGYHLFSCTNFTACSADCTFMTGATATAPQAVDLCH